MAHGYSGKILRVDLTNSTIEIEEPDELFYRRYWGGQALGSYYLLKEQDRGVDPLAPEAMLVFASGVMTGSRLPAMSRFSVVGRSPLTGSFGGSEAGGWFGPELKAAGYDAVVVKGRAEQPVYLWIHDGEVEIRDARRLWGFDTGEAQAAIRRELGEERARVVGIGPAGEKLVRYACVVNENKHVNGRGGLGAVMGAKNLKAIVARGKEPPAPYDPGAVSELAKWYAAQVMENPTTRLFREQGTTATLASLNSSGILPTNNFRSGVFSEADAIGWNAYQREIFVKAESCYACSIRCKRVVQSVGEYNVSPEYGGPEYETMAAYGSNCMVGDLRAIAKANELSNRYGLDTISTGMTIAFAMECFEKGLLTKADCDGMELRFGNPRVMLTLVERIARREGIGDLLAEGSARAAERIGGGAEAFVVAVKGQELALHDPRAKPGVGVGYAISDTGADHLVINHDPGFQMKEAPLLKTLAPLGVLEPVPALDLGPRKMRLFRPLEDIYSFWKSAGVCNFGYGPRVNVSLLKFVEMAQAVTGWDTSLAEMAKAGERTTNLAHCFNVREGFRRSDDRLPDRLFEPLPDGPLAGTSTSRQEFEDAIALLYEMKGWDPSTGIPSCGKLAELDISWVADLLEESGVPTA